MFADLIEKLRRREDLRRDQAEAVMDSVMRGEAGAAPLAALLVALSMKGERSEELAGFASAMRRHAVDPRIDASEFGTLLDTCGTGGDRAGTFNISTAAAIVAAACGVAVVKHGNRSISSRCGSADVLEALGVEPAAPPDRARKCLASSGLAFLFAPTFHPAMRHAAAVRRELGVPTAFNLLGPLSNPAAPTRQVVGVPRPELTELLARTFLLLGAERIWVVHGTDGLDELSTSGHTKVSEAIRKSPEDPGRVRTFYLHPSDLGIATAPRERLLGGEATENAEIIRRVIEGEIGPARDIVALNAAAALLVADKVETLREGLERAAFAIDRGAARETLDRFVAASRGEA
ncbi:MAG: Anthranilate phosphoribosyltransferase [Planctomycetota bacterium]